MVRKLLRRYTPTPGTLKRHWIFRQFGEHLHHNRLWRLNRRSVAGASGLGLFVAFLPVPFQIVLVTLGAFWLRANLPVAVALIFVTNPLTMAPLFYLCYRLGLWVTQTDALPAGDSFGGGSGWLVSQVGTFWWPLWAGSLTTGLMLGLAGYCLVQSLWIRHVKRKRGTLYKRLNRNR